MNPAVITHMACYVARFVSVEQNRVYKQLESFRRIS